MDAAAARTNSEDIALSELRTDFPGWRIWRAVKRDGCLGEWVATRHDPGAGVSATVMRPTPELLRAALIEERERAEMEGLR
jgi:hypothetical protein